MKSHYRDPLAFAERTFYDEKKGWGKGIVWISPGKTFSGGETMWTVGSHLDGILLHEVGHILGCSHLAGTIMDERLSDRFMISNTTEAEMNSIDQDIELRPTTKPARIYEGIHTFSNLTSIQDSFSLLVGRAPVGTVKSRLEKGYGYLYKATLALTDKTGTYRFNVHSKSRIGFITIGTSLFKIRLERPEGLMSSSMNTYASSNFGTITLADGTTRSVALNVNFAPWAYEIRLLDGNNKDHKTLFAAKAGP